MKTFSPLAHPRDFIVPDELSRYGLKPGEVKDLSYLQIEMKDKCNLACAYCRRPVTPSSKDLLSVANFERILETTPSIRQVSFVGAGETFMRKNIHEYVALCTDRGIISSVNTNGVFVEHRLEQAVVAGLGKIVISVDAVDDMLAAIGSGPTRDVLERAMLDAVRITRGAGTSVSAAITLGQGNLNQFADTLRFIVQCGIDLVTVESLHHLGDDKSLNVHSLFHGTPGRIINQIERALTVAIELGLAVEIFDFYRIGSEALGRPMHCAWPWDSAFVSCNGAVTPCCVNMVPSDRNVMGWLEDSTLDEIWRSDTYARFRRDQLDGRDWSFCKDCVYRMEFGEFF